MSRALKVIIDDNNEKWTLYKNHIKCPDGTYKFMDFINTIKYLEQK